MVFSLCLVETTIYLFLFLGTALLVLVSAEVDTTGSSYYGEQSLHFVSVRGDSSLVPLGIIVLYGSMYSRMDQVKFVQGSVKDV